MEVSARFVDEEELQALKEDGFLSFPHEFGEILIEEIPSSYAKEIKIGMSRFFKVLYVDGIYSIR